MQLALQPAPRPPRHPDRRRLLAAVPRRSPPTRRTSVVAQINAGPPGRAVGGHRRAEAGEVDGAHARPPRRAGDVRRRRRVRLPRRPRLAGARAGCRTAGSSGSTGSRRSRAGCCRRYLDYNPRFLAAFARQLRARRAAPPPRPRVSPRDHERRGRRSGPGGPAAGALLRRPRPRRDRRRARRRRCSRRSPRGRMPFHETGTQELLERVLGVGPARRPTDGVQDAAARRPHRAHARHAGVRATSRSTCRRSAAWSTTCCRCCARARR